MEWNEYHTPCYVIDAGLLEDNLKILQQVMEHTGAKILLAQKAFSCYALYPLIGRYLSGATASGLYEARLGAEEMLLPLKGQGRLCENHIFSPAYKEEDFPEILRYCDHIVFNSWKQVEKFGRTAKAAGKQIGLRINPQCSTQEGHELYDPCAKGSRLGVTYDTFVAEKDRVPNGWDKSLLEILDGLHFHTLCEQDSDALVTTLQAVQHKFGAFLPAMKWINFGGGHHITRPGYHLEQLEQCICSIRDQYDLTVYLEPGEAVALHAGFLVTSVLEVLEKEDSAPIAILDTSAACHMPDVLEMPYRPPLQHSGQPGEKQYTYRLGGPTCLAGDMIGEYSFDHRLQEGERLVFEDMAIYSMVKNNTFNGMPLPSIWIRDRQGVCHPWKSFGYEDFKERL